MGEKRNSTSKTLAKNKRRKGPHLPNSILKTIANEKRPLNSDEEDDEIDSDDANGDVYEYEEGVPEEESRKNNRYDRVDNYEYELPEDYKDENVDSDDGDDESGNSDNEEGEGYGERHTRMLQSVTRMPSAAFDGESKRKPVLFTEAYPESEFNPTRDVLEGKSLLTVEDLLAPLQGKPGFNDLQKRISRMQKDTQAVVHAPLPRPERERLERKAVKGLVDKEFNKWVHQVKRNRETPTVYFNQNVSLGYSTVGAIASEFQPRTDFEKKMASVLNDNELGEAHNEDGAKLLELNEVSKKDQIKYLDHIAKMRSLLFRHELKSKRIKKIKSKTYHRLKGKDLKKSAMGALMDPEMAKEEAMKQEARRVEERMTLKHKNTGKWAKRMLSRGLNVRYDGTRAAISEQLQINATLSRKMNSTNDGSSSDESDDEEELNDGSDQDTPSKLIAKAREKTLKTLEDDVPNSGLLSLPFMARAMKKKNEEANEEAKRALEEYEEWENSGGEENPKKTANVSGRRVFGATAKVEAPKESKKDSDNFYDNSDSDNDMEGIENNDLGDVRDTASPARNTGAITETEKFSDDVENPASKTTFDVALFASGSWKKMKGSQNAETKKSPKKHVPYSKGQDKKETRDEESEDSESEAEQMVDGILTSASKETYEIPSQAELIQRAFAGDDVVDEFQKDKQEVLNQEVPEPEKPVLVPGWGQWTNIQKKRGLPLWMVREHEDALEKRKLDLKTRKDARLKHVIISEKVDKKADKLHTKTLPFPYTSKEVFENSMRMPIGPEFNPATVVGALNRPEVVKKVGVIIKPLKFEEVNPNEKVDDEHPRSNQKQKPRKGGKTGKGQSKGKSKQKTKA